MSAFICHLVGDICVLFQMGQNAIILFVFLFHFLYMGETVMADVHIPVIF